MGFLDNIRDRADEVRDEVEDTVDEVQDEVKERIDQGREAVDNVKDTVEKNTGVDVDRDGDIGSGGGSSSSGGGSSSSGSGPDVSSGGSSSSSSSSSGSSSSGSRVNPVQEMAENIKSSNRGKADIDNLSRQDIDNIQSSRTDLQERLNPTETQALASREQNLENKQKASQQVENIRNAPDDAVFTNNQGKELTKNEALEQAKNDVSSIEQALDNQADAVNNARNVNRQRSLTREERIKQKAESINFNPSNEAATDAGSFLLDVSERIPAYTDTLFSDRGGQFLGSFIPGTDKTPDQVVEERVASLQLKQESSNPEINIAETGRLSSPPTLLVGGAAGGATFRGIGKGIGQLTTKGQKIWRGAGAVTGAAATGTEAGKAINQFNRGETTRAAGTVIDFTSLSAGFAGGAKSFTNRFGARKGNTQIDQAQVIRPGDPITGRGQFTARTNIINTNFQSPVQGQGPVKTSLSKPFTARFQGPVKGSLQKPVTRNGLKPEVQNPLGNIGFRRPNAEFSFQKPLNIQRQSSELNFRSPTKTVTEQQTTTGKFGILNDQAQGTFSTVTPKGKSRSGEFQAISIPKNSYRNSQGQRVEISGDITRQQTESRFFRNFQDRTGRTKNIQTNKRDSSAEEVLGKFDNIALKSDTNVKALEISSVSRDGQTNFGDTTTFVLGKKSGGRNAGGSSSTQGQSGSSSGGGQGSNQVSIQSGQGQITGKLKSLSNDISSQVRTVASREASRTVSNQKDSSLTTLPTSGEASTIEMGRGNDADVQTFEGNIESSQQFQRNTGTKQKTASQETQTNQVTDSGPQILSRGNSQDLRTRSKQILGLDQKQGQANRQRVIPENIFSSLQRQRLSQVPGLQQKTSQFTNQKLGLGTRQLNPPRSRQRLSQRFNTNLASFQTNARLQAFGVPGPGLSGKTGNLQATGLTNPSNQGPGSSGLELDWISSNYVDQRGDTPTFDLTDTEARSTFGGILAEEEQEAKKRENKGFNSIW